MSDIIDHSAIVKTTVEWLASVVFTTCFKSIRYICIDKVDKKIPT